MKKSSIMGSRLWNSIALFFLTFLFLSLSAFSQMPQTFSYQAVARNSSGQLLANTALTVSISILSGTVIGPVVWEETHGVTTNEYGLFTIEIGSGAKTGGSATDFSLIDWGSDTHYMKTEVDDGGGYADLGTVRLLAVPYALSAESVGALKKLDITGDAGAPVDSALFVVRRSDGQIVFAVYNDGVRIYVDENPGVKRSKGGFAIGGFDAVKGVSKQFLNVSGSSSAEVINPSESRIMWYPGKEAFLSGRFIR